MAPPRTFSYERLRVLLRDHPDWQYSQYAEALTQDNRRVDPASRRVKPDSVRRVVSEYRDEWEEEGDRLPVRGVVMADLLPRLGAVAPNQRMTTPLRYLREISKQRRGEDPLTDNEHIIRRQALRWEQRLRDNKEIVDLTEQGSVVIRPARADELDDQGRLVDLAAWTVPGYEYPGGRVSGRGRG